MKFSAWLSLAISACSALLFVAPAAAHVVASPSFVAGGSTSILTFAAPNERDVPMTALTVTVPSGFKIEDARSTGTWRATVHGRTATWSGGRIAAKAIENFALDVKARTGAGDVQFDAVQLYPDREVVKWPVALTVVPGSKPGQNLGAALVAGLLGLLGLTGLVVFLWQRRLGSLQEK
jgi:uncharacterized protein YcnI